MKFPRAPRNPRRQSGVGLLEVLIAVLVLGVGLLGIAAMQATALRSSQSSVQRSQAVILTYSILDSMRTNRAAALAGAYNMAAMTCAVPSGGTLAQNDINAWMATLRTDKVLSSTGCGQVSCVADVCTATVQWNDSRAAGSSTESVSTVSRI